MSTKHEANPINQTKFAKKLGITRQAVNNAIAKGQLVKHGKGRAAFIDQNCPLTIAYIKNPSVNRHTGKDTKPPAQPAAPAPSKPEKKSAPESPENIASVQAFVDNQDVKKQKIQQELEKLRLHNQARRGELVERDQVQGFIDAMYSIHNGQLRTLGLRVSADLAAIFGIEDDNLIRKACNKIDKDMLTILKQIKRDMNKFMKKIGGQKIKDEGKAA